MENLNKHFIAFALNRSLKYKKMAESAIAQLNDEEIHISHTKHDNNIAVIAKHICGNIKSRWTDFKNSDGEKSWRNREGEFVDDVKDKASLLKLWELSWSIYLGVLQDLNPEELMDLIEIRKENHTILEAILRQLTHYASHVGQILYLAKSIRGDQWVTLSIPKGGSEAFNKTMGL